MSLVWFRAFLSLALASSVGGTAAQQWTIFDMDNSPLPSTTVKALASDGGAGVWVGTNWGLCHYDGSGNWEIYQEGTSPLLGNDISSLQVDAEGRVWIGMVDMGLQLKDGSVWTNYTTVNSGLPENGIRDLFLDGTGALWCCTSNGLVRFDGADWVVYNDSPESFNGAVLATSNMRAVAVRDDGTICLATFNGGLHFIQGSTVDVLTVTGDGFFDNTAVDVLFHPQTGDRWVATPAAGLLRQQGPVFGGLWSQWNGSIGFPSNATTALAVDPGGRVWTGTQIAGIVGVNADGTFDQYTAENSGLPDNDIRCLYAGSDGSIWVGTFLGGLARFDPTVDVHERPRAQHWSVWPNPAHDQVFVKGPSDGHGVEWEVLSTTGALLRSGRSPHDLFTIPLAEFAPGCYQLRMVASGLVETRMVLVD